MVNIINQVNKALFEMQKQETKPPSYYAPAAIEQRIKP